MTIEVTRRQANDSSGRSRRPRILSTDALHPEAAADFAQWAEVEYLPDGLSRSASDQALRDAVARIDGLVVRRQLPGDLFEAPGTLRAVMRQGVGLDFIPVDRATTRGIPVANTPSVNANAVAEYVMSALLTIARRLDRFDADVRRGDWQSRQRAATLTSELRGKTLGILGMGAVGRRIAEIAGLGFGMRIVACTRNANALPPAVAAASLEDMFGLADAVVVACPLTEETRGIVDAQALRRATPRCVLVNVGRGPVVDELALIDALRAGRIAGAVLDVFATQPLPEDSPLRADPRILLTPHIAGLTDEAERAMGVLASQTLRALLEGERPTNVVNPEVFGALRAPGAPSLANQETTS